MAWHWPYDLSLLALNANPDAEHIKKYCAGNMAVAHVRRDAQGEIRRPTSITLCPAVMAAPTDALAQVLVHEVAHAAGFSGPDDQWRNHECAATTVEMYTTYVNGVVPYKFGWVDPCELGDAMEFRRLPVTSLSVGPATRDQ